MNKQLKKHDTRQRGLNTPRHMKRRFTLIELLVVIAIIAILASLILPALRGVKAKVETIQCMNIERQTLLHLISYVGDYDVIPPHGTWLNQLTAHGFNYKAFNCKRRDGSGVTLACPTITSVYYTYFNGVPYRAPVWNPGSYNITGRMQATPSGRVKYPSKAGVLNEGTNGYTDGYFYWVNSATPSNYWQHGANVDPSIMLYWPVGSMNIGFYDGHVENIFAKQAALHWYGWCIYDFNFNGHNPDL